MVVSLIMMFSIQTYAQTATVKEKLVDDTYIVTITDNGVTKEYKALPPNQIRDLLKQQGELVITKVDYSNLLLDFSKFRVQSELKHQQDIDTASLEYKKRDDKIAFWQSEYNKELKLRESFGTTLGRCHKFIIWRIC